MFSNEYKNEMIKKFNLSESIINSSKHYKIPKFVFKEKNDINNQCLYHHPANSLFKLQLQSNPGLLLEKKSQLSKFYKTQYSENKKKKIYSLMTKIQREKIDLLINRAYQQINNNIRKYNKSISIPKNKTSFKLQSIPLINREFIIDHVMGQVEKYLPDKNMKNNTFEKNKIDEDKDLFNYKFKNQFIWSHNFMEEKQMDDYRKKYRIKYIKTENQLKDYKLKKEKVKIDKSLPEIIKIRTNMFFSTPKNKIDNVKKDKKNINIIGNRTNYKIYKNLNK